MYIYRYSWFGASEVSLSMALSRLASFPLLTPSPPLWFQERRVVVTICHLTKEKVVTQGVFRQEKQGEISVRQVVRE